MSVYRGGLGGLLDQLAAYWHVKTKRERLALKGEKKAAKAARMASYALQPRDARETEPTQPHQASLPTTSATSATSAAASADAPPQTAAIRTATQAVDELKKQMAGMDATMAELAEAFGGKLPDFVPPPPTPNANAKPSAQVAFESARATAQAAAAAAATARPATNAESPPPTEPEPEDVRALRDVLHEGDEALREEAKDGKLPGEPGYPYNNEAAGANLPGLPGGPTPLPFAPPKITKSREPEKSQSQPAQEPNGSPAPAAAAGGDHKLEFVVPKPNATAHDQPPTG